jgi:predicted metallo-beta-lactamase superfamily hydrolase
MIPIRTQNEVNREYTTIQDAQWELKVDEADDKVKIIIAKEFPEFYKRKYLDPYEEQSELYNENKAILQNLQHANNNQNAREYKLEGGGLETRAVW